MDFKELQEKIQQNWSQMQAHMDLQQEEVKKFGQKDAEREQTILTFSSKITDLETQIKSLRAEASRPVVAGTMVASRDMLDGEQKARHDLFVKGLRYGVSDLYDEERKQFRELYSVKASAEDRTTTSITMGRDGKALSIGDDTTGGYLAPPEFVQDIIKGVQLISPIRSIARIRQTSRRSVQYPVRSGVFAAQWVQETGTRNETKGLTFSLEEIPNHEMYADVLVSDQDLEDSVFDLEQEILDNCSEQFAKAEGAAFVNGSGIGQPEGFLTNANIAADATSFVSASHTLNPDALIQEWGNLKTAYTKGAMWLMNRKTIAAVRALKDAQGRYIWQPGLADGTVPTILESPYLEVPDMPDLPSAAGTTYPIMYGNFQRGYLIVDRLQVVVRRLQEKYAETGQIAYLVRKRVGGQVVLPEAIRKMAVTYA